MTNVSAPQHSCGKQYYQLWELGICLTCMFDNVERLFSNQCPSVMMLYLGCNLCFTLAGKNVSICKHCLSSYPSKLLLQAVSCCSSGKILSGEGNKFNCPGNFFSDESFSKCDSYNVRAMQLSQPVKSLDVPYATVEH